VDINVKVRFESPEIIAALLAFAEALPQMKLATILQVNEGQVIEAKGIVNKLEYKNEESAIGEVKDIQVKSIALEDVRAKLAVLSQNGKQAQVKAIIKKFGANKLTEVGAENYEALLKEVEGL
jgi:hypothetical protein